MKKPSAEQVEARSKGDAALLRYLADWFDVYDNKRDYRGEREVQNNLRRIATTLSKRLRTGGGKARGK